MELRTLRYLVAVAEGRRLGRAAARLCVSGPPPSRAIEQLEAALGASLLERSRAGGHAHPARREARALLERADQVRERVAAAAGAAVLAVGMLGDVADPVARRLAAAYRS